MMAMIDSTVETTSSAMLTGMFPAPPVVAVTAVGVAGTGLARYDAFGAGGDHSAASNPH